MWTTITILLLSLIVTVLSYYVYTLSLEIKDLKLTANTSDLVFRGRFEYIEERLDNINRVQDKLAEITTIQSSLLRLHNSYLSKDQYPESSEDTFFTD